MTAARPVGRWAPVSLVAFNTATESENRIHDDSVARKFGFRGGLVPGVDVHAYMTQLPVAAWGLEWLRRGTIFARFREPVYDGETVTVSGSAVGDETVELSVESTGRVCATGRAILPDGVGVAPVIADYPEAPLPADPPPASEASLPAGAILGSLSEIFRAAEAPAYLDAVRDAQPLYRREGVAHPGFLIRRANDILKLNVRLGPWIHVESEVRHFGLVRDGEAILTRGRVVGTFERKGHRFVTLDVALFSDGGRPLIAARHTAIYAPRGVA
ncbi:MaoC/PaaZ C-terminal domain-containing protein [Oceanibacterium hippocampi]|uniref:Uncharacterized protein n=1 Tax=Oceanibacterium hippocampi TaxID=745714 RepID=A0A1Y5SRL7_9PROT|nr:MaoC/PaaZ C-terminal domain-containing protein [Oceanibacterium hippocampi]SLN46841.1 hypothetical protein OCH7691_02009 [Oceanibacterium hippocampi]